MKVQRITSRSNDTIKWIKSLQQSKIRFHEGKFYAEGIRLLEEIPDIYPIDVLVICPDLIQHKDRSEMLIKRLSGRAERIIEVNPPVMESMTETQTSQGVLAVLPLIRESVNRQFQFALALDNISDPGNMGTILRTARAAAVDQIFLLGSCVDVFNPKVVRSASGAHFHLNMAHLPPDFILPENTHVRIAAMKQGHHFKTVNWAEKTLLIIGSEAHGHLTTLTGSLQPEYVHIPMANQSESLNVAVAAGILLFEAFTLRFNDMYKI